MSEKISPDVLLPIAKELYKEYVGVLGLEKIITAEAREKRIVQVTDDFARFFHLLQEKLTPTA